MKNQDIIFGTRPVLEAIKSGKTIEKLFYDRDHIYRELADHVVIGGNEQIKQVVSNLELIVKSKQI